MTTRVVRSPAAGDGALEDAVRAIQRELGLTPEFPPEVKAAAQAAAEHPVLPELDRTDIPFVTLDPGDSQTLDRAVHLERDGDGYLVHCAIADLAAFIEPGGAVDVQAHRRGETLYGDTSTVPMLPPVLTEAAASLLPDQIRPALLWTIKLDRTGEGTDVDVRRAAVRSRAKLSYQGVQSEIDAGSAGEMFTVLQEVGERRLSRERVRGGIGLPLLEQEVVVEGDRWSRRFRPPLPVEVWNAQVCLLIGMAAAHLMLYAEIGVLRTMPDADPRVLQWLHRLAAGLGVRWPSEQLYPDFLRGLDYRKAEHAALVNASTALLRDAGYVAFDGAVPVRPEHTALASEYAHVTAPLRRLVDRYAGEVCVALCADQPVPEWVRSALHALPNTMAESSHRAARYHRAILDQVEARVLAPSVGEVFTAVVTDVQHDASGSGSVVLRDPPIEARIEGSQRLALGQEVRVKLVQADPSTRTIRFEPAPD
ncbi:MAG: RNB domain-containing ribonuclease [Nocardioidaceae bacterium]